MRDIILVMAMGNGRVPPGMQFIPTPADALGLKAVIWVTSGRTRNVSSPPPFPAVGLVRCGRGVSVRRVLPLEELDLIALCSHGHMERLYKIG